MSSNRARLAALLVFLFIGKGRAALPDEIQVYTDDLNAPGESGVELHVNTTPSGRSAPDYPGEVTTHHGLRITPEISYGIAKGWDAGIYLPFIRSGEGTEYFAGPKLRLKWLPLAPGEGGSGPFAGVNGELALVQEKFDLARRTLEIRPILGLRSESWLFAFNPTVGTDLAGNERGVLMFHPSAKVARDVGGGTALGFEYYADLGRLSRLAPRDEQQHTLYFVVDTKRINFGVGRGLNNATDRWTIKAIFDF